MPQGLADRRAGYRIPYTSGLVVEARRYPRAVGAGSRAANWPVVVQWSPDRRAGPRFPQARGLVVGGGHHPRAIRAERCTSYPVVMPHGFAVSPGRRIPYTSGFISRRALPTCRPD